ncbi:MAG: hypothetical protein COY40_05690 [Alphaproteobacteria bacterium CG_4_10_14_0_8_um_filter_53_9]|nr:MAG: hypothetical protein COY40_05690 [Alphaproteobacteria bacterium CG_4_10_14_0_8_um_filter_53_9]
MKKQKTPSQKAGRTLFIILLSVFGVVFVANGFLIYYATSSFSGLTSPNAYEEGLRYQPPKKPTS